jgi:hypothetical protein
VGLVHARLQQRNQKAQAAVHAAALLQSAELCRALVAVAGQCHAVLQVVVVVMIVARHQLRKVLAENKLKVVKQFVNC